MILLGISISELHFIQRQPNIRAERRADIQTDSQTDERMDGKTKLLTKLSLFTYAVCDEKVKRIVQ